MRIIVATGAVQTLPVIDHGRLRLELRRFLVTVGAWNRDVPACQHKVRLLVFRKAESRRLVTLKIVAAVACVEVRSRGKLCSMLVGVTVGAALELNLEQRVLPFRDVALHTLQSRMLALQRIRAGGMLLHRKGRGLPSLHGVAGSALPAVRTLGKLPVVRIVLVAVHALLEHERLFEIAAGVALGAIDAGVLAFQRVFGLGVVEAFVDRLQRNLLPPVRAVARLAALWEAAVMRVPMTVGALVERNAHVLWLAVCSIRVALGALHLGMQAGQGIARLGVIELGLAGLADIDGLPVHEIVALQAVWTEASLVLVFVATDATGRQPQVSPARILDLDRRAFLGCNAGGVVTLITRQPCMLAFQQISRFFVIESLDVPLDQREVFPVVLRVAPGAFLAGSGRNVVRGV